MDVRLCRKSDISDTVALYNAFNKTRLSPRRFERLMAMTKGRDFVFCGIVHGRAVGYLVLKIDIDIESAGKRAEVTDFYVRPKYRGLGLGRKLLKGASRLAKKKGAKRLLVLTENVASRAKRLYMSEGFKKMRGAIVRVKKL